MTFIARLKEKIQNSLNAYTKIEIQDNSSQHSGHTDMNSHSHSHSHLHLVIVSNDFVNLDRMERQRKIYKLFANEFKNNEIHALTFDLKTELEQIKN